MAPYGLIPAAGARFNVGQAVQKVKRNWIIITIAFAVFLAIVLTDFGLLAFWDSYSFITAALLAAVGIMFIFSKSWMNKIIMGAIPLIMALASLPFLEDVSFFGWFGPGFFRSIILAVLFFYYFFFGYKQENRASYKQMASDSAKTGFAVAKKSSPVIKFLIFAIVTGGIYLLEIYLDIIGIIITGLVLLVMAVLLFFRKGIVGKLLGLIALVLALPNIAQFVPGMGEFLDVISFSNYLGFDTWPRYILVAIIAFYWQFRKKAWAQTDVQQL